MSSTSRQAREQTDLAVADRTETYMKQKLLCGLMVLVLAPAALSQTPASYENFGLVQCPPDIPPTIDASNFINLQPFGELTAGCGESPQLMK